MPTITEPSPADLRRVAPARKRALARAALDQIRREDEEAYAAASVYRRGGAALALAVTQPSISTRGVVDRNGARFLEIGSPDDVADLIRSRATVDYSNTVPDLQREGSVSLKAFPGGRVAPLLGVFPVEEGKVAVVVSEGTRTNVAGIAPYGTALPESAVSFSKADVVPARFGATMPVEANVLEDAGVAEKVVRELLTQDALRDLDLEVLTGGGTTAGGDEKHFLGLTVDPAVTANTITVAGAGSRTAAVLQAARDIRASDATGPIHVVIGAGDLYDLTTEAGQRFEATMTALRSFGVVPEFVISSLIPSGSVLVADFARAATLIPRSGVSLSSVPDHGSQFMQRIVQVSVEFRAQMSLRHAGAIRLITGF